MINEDESRRGKINLDKPRYFSPRPDKSRYISLRLEASFAGQTPRARPSQTLLHLA